MLKNLKRNKKGFTLVELIIVIAIIGILAAVLVPTMIGVVGKANAQKAGSDLDATFKPLQSAATSFTVDGQVTDLKLATFIIYVNDAITAQDPDLTQIKQDISFVPVADTTTEVTLPANSCVKNAKIIFVQVVDDNVRQVLGGVSFIQDQSKVSDAKAKANSYGSTGTIPPFKIGTTGALTVTPLKAAVSS